MRLDYDKRQRLVYFVSKALSEVENRYSNFEQVALALRNGSKETPAVFSSSHHSSAHELADQSHTPQTRYIRAASEVGNRTEQV